MIRKKFKEWAEGSITLLKNQSISTEFVELRVDDIGYLAKPFIRIIHESENAMGQVIIYESKEMEFEVIHIQTEKMLLWKYFENIDDDIDFNEGFKSIFPCLKKWNKTTSMILNKKEV